MRKWYITLLLMITGAISANTQAQAPLDSATYTEYREKIGFDMSFPDFDTKKIDAAVMGERNAKLIEYMMENYHQAFYGQQIARGMHKQSILPYCT